MMFAIFVQEAAVIKSYKKDTFEVMYIVHHELFLGYDWFDSHLSSTVCLQKLPNFKITFLLLFVWTGKCRFF